MTLGELIKGHRRGLGLSQDAAAFEVGGNGSSWHRWECGVYCPSTPTMGRIADMLQWSDEELGKAVRLARRETKS